MYGRPIEKNRRPLRSINFKVPQNLKDLIFLKTTILHKASRCNFKIHIVYLQIKRYIKVCKNL